ncbi:helix-turn-helix domain-containing protein [Trueperella pecoris]|uniref:Helix-turn-helix domain-containing protein n=1 Tax=Trueperella pecoris TaxID=2733571 RepID=A0A7M1R096_9ACTO|nr:helix-turn-helix domain-containing protein [Trueperella pecoris]QOR47608.1 helix-turn-helix domain-containing protein [Trueperella pecoris]
MSKLSYSLKEAAEATGLSEDVVRRAVRAGELPTLHPTVDGRKITKILIPATALREWLGTTR